jgi:hypothetical protein
MSSIFFFCNIWIVKIPVIREPPTITSLEPSPVWPLLSVDSDLYPSTKMNAYPAGMVPKRAHLYVGNLSPRVVRLIFTFFFSLWASGRMPRALIIDD